MLRKQPSVRSKRGRQNLRCPQENVPLTVYSCDIYSIRKICYTSDGYIMPVDEEIKRDIEKI